MRTSYVHMIQHFIREILDVYRDRLNMDLLKVKMDVHKKDLHILNTYHRYLFQFVQKTMHNNRNLGWLNKLMKEPRYWNIAIAKITELVK
jgi:hypothetical protein